jgi:hypothetical protein
VVCFWSAAEDSRRRKVKENQQTNIFGLLTVAMISMVGGRRAPGTNVQKSKQAGDEQRT